MPRSVDLKVHQVQTAINRLMTEDAVREFVAGDPRKAAEAMATARIASIYKNEKAPAMVIDPSALQRDTVTTEPGAADPLDATSRPRNKKEAKAVAEAAAANRPFQPPPPAINPRSRKEKLTDRERCWEMEILRQTGELVHRNMPDIRVAYDQTAETHSETNRKMVYPVSLSYTIASKDGEVYEIDGKISFAVKHTDGEEAEVRVGDPDNPDLVDQMED